METQRHIQTGHFAARVLRVSLKSANEAVETCVARLFQQQLRDFLARSDRAKDALRTSLGTVRHFSNCL
jgi:hypothetical protein